MPRAPGEHHKLSLSTFELNRPETSEEAFLVAVSSLGNAWWLFVGLILLVAAAFWIFRFRLEAVVLLGICLTSSLLTLLVKLLIARPRPAQPLVTVLQPASANSRSKALAGP